MKSNRAQKPLPAGVILAPVNVGTKTTCPPGEICVGNPLFKKGEPVIVTGKEAAQVWIWKALKTQRTRYEIYSWNFGSEVETLIGQNYSQELKQAEAARYVREALEINPYITSVTGIKVDFADCRLTITAIVNTIYGEVEANV